MENIIYWIIACLLLSAGGTLLICGMFGMVKDMEGGDAEKQEELEYMSPQTIKGYCRKCEGELEVTVYTRRCPLCSTLLVFGENKR